MRPDAACLVTGGLSGFGLATARWLAEKGAGALVLIGRSGPTSEEARAAIAEFEQRGVHVIARACDVTDASAVGTLFDEAEAAGFPIRGIVHAAAAFDDATMETLDQRQYPRVIEPKIRSAIVLHDASLGREVRFCILYIASITTAFGNPGQANYCRLQGRHDRLFLKSLAQEVAAPCNVTIRLRGAIGVIEYLARNDRACATNSHRSSAPTRSARATPWRCWRAGARDESNFYAAWH